MVDYMRCATEYAPIVGSYSQIIEHSKEDNVIITIFGIRKSRQKIILLHIFSILSLGIPYVLLSWYPQFRRKSSYVYCKLEEATSVLVLDNLKQSIILPLHTVDSYYNDQHQNLRCFEYQHSKYVWKISVQEFQKIDSFGRKYQLNDLSNASGLTESQAAELRKIYGLNRIDIEIKTYWHLFVNEVFNPFYVFQAFSIILWSFDEYYQYAGCILFLSMLSIVTSLYQTKKQSIALHDLVESSSCHSVHVCRPNGLIGDVDLETAEFEMIETCMLVPGDIILIPRHGCIMPCDAVLLSGTCIVNESMLTGESVPVTKTTPNPSEETFDPVKHKRYTLFSGTQIIQTRYYGDSKVLALVVRTGFETAKGELVKSILYPKPMGFKFYRDSMRFVLFLFVTAAIGMTYCVYLYVARDATISMILLRTLDIITIVVPPALPAAMTAGTVYSQSRLKSLGIFCISPPRINVAGKLKLVCFDKTGTLTHDGLNFYAVVPVEKAQFSPLETSITQLDQKRPLIETMATCHSLTRLDGNISGDPLDLNMFEATKWILEEPGSECSRYDMLAPTIVYPPSESTDISTSKEDICRVPYQIGIIRQFPFSSSEQCMSVICRTLGSRYFTLYSKGAPEKIISMCDPATVPVNFNSLLTNFAMKGYRIIALAYTNLSAKLKWKDAQKISRDEIEHHLEFLGLLIMQNALKAETTPIIEELHKAKIRTVMITGDNIMTAISVSRDCGMVSPVEQIVMVKTDASMSPNPDGIPNISFELVSSSNLASTNFTTINRANFSSVLDLNTSAYHFAMDGGTWSVLKKYYTDWIPKLIFKGTIYARFGPEQKTQLVMSLQDLDYVVGMVGDGANDCGALKAAHIGISLSEAEASVAAPFTSSMQNISCVKYITLEGRCALVTSFAIFKYMAMYSFIQFASVLILYTRYSTLGNMEFLFIDLVITTSLAVSMGRQGPSKKLVPKRPMGSLVSAANLVPLILQVVTCVVIQILALYYLTKQDWYSPIKFYSVREDDEIVVCWDNTVVYTISCFQYISLAFVYSKGKPFRKPIITNGLLMCILLSLTGFCVFLLIYPIEPFADFFEVIPREADAKKNAFRETLIIFPLIQFVIAIIIETCIAECRWLKIVVHFLTGKKQPKNRYKLVGKEMKQSDFWLSISSDFDSSGVQC